MEQQTASNDESPREKTARVCDSIRDELGFEENKGSFTLTQTEKRQILNELSEE